MEKNHRIVYSPHKELLYISSRRQGATSGTLNNSAANLLLKLNNEALTSEKERLYAKNEDFFNECFANGWVDEDLNLSAPIRVAEGEHHLRSIQIELLLKCNLSCGYCYCAAGNKRKEALSTQDVLDILNDAERLGVLHVDFTGGEFFLYPDWKLILQHTKNLGLPLSIHTNGMALTESNVAFISEIGVTKVQVSADGADEQIHNETRGNKKAFSMMGDGIKRLQAVGIRPKVNIMVHKKTKDHIVEYADYFSKLGCSVNYDWIAPFGSENSSQLGITPAEFFEAITPLRDKNDLVSLPKPCGRDLGWKHNHYEPSCGVGYSYLFITATGEIAICPTLTSRENSELFNSPNIRDISLYEAWTGHSYYDKHRHVNCKNVETCPAGTLCRGGCRANAYAQSGQLDAPNMIECNLRKNHTDTYVDFSKRYQEGDFSLVERTN